MDPGPSSRPAGAQKRRGGKKRAPNSGSHAEEDLAKQAHSIARSTRIPVSLQQAAPLPGARPPKSLGKIEDKKLRAKLARTALEQRRAQEHARLADDFLNAPAPGEEAGLIETETALERTARITQREIRESVAVDSARKSFALDLPGGKASVGLGPYRHDYTRNGRHLLLGGRKGHLAAFDWQAGKLLCEIQVQETVRDVKWLHNTSFFAAAQKKYTYIYDSQGAEVHRLKDHIEVQRMEFLPYHFLLATVGNAGYLKYQDTSTGLLVSQHRSGLGACSTMAQNPLSAVIHLGHANGTVTMWTPNLSTPALKMLAHRGPLSGVAVSTRDGGRELATSGLDGGIKVWDVRMLGRGAVREWTSRKPASDLKYSQRGLLGAAWGSHVSVYNTKAPLGNAPPGPYLTNGFPTGPPISIGFCPFEDVLGVAHAKGFDSLVVPGSGEPKYDSTEADPYENKNSRREREVHALLDKIQPDMITLDPAMLGQLDTAGSRSADQPRAGSPPASGKLAKAADGRPYARLTRLERLRLDGAADEGEEPAVADGGRGLDSDDEAEADPNQALTGSYGAAAAPAKGVKEKHKMRGKNSAMKRYLRKQKQNVIDPNALAVRAKLARAKDERAAQAKRDARVAAGLPAEEVDNSALAYFGKKRGRGATA